MNDKTARVGEASVTLSAIEQVNQLLPQTQCGQCGYGGCLPYAQAMVEQGEALNRCPPGGCQTLKALGNYFQRDVTPWLAAMQAQALPPTLAYIREMECIGCTKCIQACPVDAILGAAKQSHTVLADECTGCGLCIPPCPVDCIDQVTVSALRYDPQKAKHRYQAKQMRTQNKSNEKPVKVDPLQQQRDYIAAAVARVKSKKRNTQSFSLT